MHGIQRSESRTGSVLYDREQKGERRAWRRLPCCSLARAPWRRYLAVPMFLPMLFVPDGLHAVSERRADHRALLPAHERARNRADDRALRAAVALRPVIAVGSAGR